MTKKEFLPIMGFLEAATQKPLSKASVDVYFDLLGDLPADVLQIAARRVALAHVWATFPSAAELRQAASETQRGAVSVLSPAEAWELAWRAVGRIDLDIPGSVEKHTAKLPPLVLDAMQAFGIPALVAGKEPVGVVRGQFFKVFEQLAAREERLALLPAPLQKQIASKRPALPAPVTKALESIGNMEAVNPFEEMGKAKESEAANGKRSRP